MILFYIIKYNILILEYDGLIYNIIEEVVNIFLLISNFQISKICRNSGNNLPIERLENGEYRSHSVLFSGSTLRLSSLFLIVQTDDS